MTGLCRRHQVLGAAWAGEVYGVEVQEYAGAYNQGEGDQSYVPDGLKSEATPRPQWAGEVRQGQVTVGMACQSDTQESELVNRLEWEPRACQEIRALNGCEQT